MFPGLRLLKTIPRSSGYSDDINFPVFIPSLIIFNFSLIVISVVSVPVRTTPPLHPPRGRDEYRLMDNIPILIDLRFVCSLQYKMLLCSYVRNILGTRIVLVKISFNKTYKNTKDMKLFVYLVDPYKSLKCKTKSSGLTRTLRHKDRWRCHYCYTIRLLK